MHCKNGRKNVLTQKYGQLLPFQNYMVLTIEFFAFNCLSRPISCAKNGKFFYEETFFALYLTELEILKYLQKHILIHSLLKFESNCEISVKKYAVSIISIFAKKKHKKLLQIRFCFPVLILFLDCAKDCDLPLAHGPLPH